MKAMIVLEDGTVFNGSACGAQGELAGTIIFNTQVVGYQEIITDPANKGKIVAMGYPHIGNYGINDRCRESDSAQVAALVVKEFSKLHSNWQAKGSLIDYMKKNKVIGIEGVDTQALTTHIRDHGEMRAIVSTKDFKKDRLLKKLKTKNPAEAHGHNQKKAIKALSSQPKVIINLGASNSTLNRFPDAQVVPADITADAIIKLKAQQVIISGGPDDPRKLTGLASEVKKLIGRVQIYGIQNGACVLAMALGASVYKMKVGHHGVNHPVVEPDTGRGEISIQNHSFGVEKLPDKVDVVHINLNDKTIEKFQTKDGKNIGTLYFTIDERGKLPKGYKFVE